MVSIRSLYILLSVVFLFVPVAQVVVNPASITDPPTSENSISVVDRSASQSVALFAIVLVVIQFILEDGRAGYYQELTIGVLAVCAGFLMVVFIMELFGDIRIVLFHLQITALRYSGLLLFSGLFFLLKSYELNPQIQLLLGLFVGLSWLTWIIHEAHYLFKSQRDDWNDLEADRINYIREEFEEWISDQ